MAENKSVDEDVMEPSLKNLIDQTSLKWIFVGGKGGVGKTTTSCGLACALAKYRKSVLLVSTDPAHNLSDAFGQKFTKEPTGVKGFDNLFAMEIDPTVEAEQADVLDGDGGNIMAELASSIPGIDEAMSFSELMKQVQSMKYDVVVFDTAPTGHTLRLLSFPSVMENAFAKFETIKSRFSVLFTQMSSMMQQQNQQDQVMGKLDQVKQTIASVNQLFKDPNATTFVCVCIPEFLSLFETERLVQELSKFEIDVHNVVVNQVLVPDADSSCRKCGARVKIQTKYLNQIHDLYDDFNVTELPLLEEEVRGPEALLAFSAMMLDPDIRPSQT